MLISSLFYLVLVSMRRNHRRTLAHRRFARRLDFCANGRWPLATKLLYVFCRFSFRGGMPWILRIERDHPLSVSPSPRVVTRAGARSLRPQYVLTGRVGSLPQYQ
jgi:hypothetical protein